MQYNVKGNWRSKQIDFDLPYSRKELVDFYVEGYINQSSSITISLLFDDNGYTQVLTTTFSGDEDDFVYSAPKFNLFGFNAFGIERFGSNDDQSGKNKFRIYLSREVKTKPFYNIQVEFASDGQNQQWEVLHFAFKVREYSMPILKRLIRFFK